MEQGNVFRLVKTEEREFLIGCLNPFGTGQCLSTTLESKSFELAEWSQSLWNRAMSFDPNEMFESNFGLWSQSLWNRAMSFDNFLLVYKKETKRLNPFGTGQCLSTKTSKCGLMRTAVSIPLEQGNVFRLALAERNQKSIESLNPFGTGQCLST